MNKDEKKELKKRGRMFQRLYDIFFAGGFARVPTATTSPPESAPFLYETVLVEPAHVMCCRMPVGKMGDALATLMKDSGCSEDFKYPDLQFDEGSMYPMYYILEALNALSLTDEWVRLRFKKDYPIEIRGGNSNIQFLIAPRIESGE